MFFLRGCLGLRIEVFVICLTMFISGCDGVDSGGNNEKPPVSTTSEPTGISAVSVSSSSIRVTWRPPTDSNGVTGYRVYRNGIFISQTNQLSFNDSNHIRPIVIRLRQSMERILSLQSEPDLCCHYRKNRKLIKR